MNLNTQTIMLLNEATNRLPAHDYSFTRLLDEDEHYLALIVDVCKYSGRSTTDTIRDIKTLIAQARGGFHDIQ